MQDAFHQYRISRICTESADPLDRVGFVFGPFGTKNSKSVTIGDCLLRMVFAPRSTPREQRFLSVKTTKVEAFQADLEEFLRVLCGEKGFCGAVIGAIRS